MEVIFGMTLRCALMVIILTNFCWAAPQLEVQGVQASNITKESTEREARSGRNCKCVPIYQCKNGKIFQDGSYVVVAKAGPQPVSSGNVCNDPLQVCCQPPDEVPKPPNPSFRNRIGCGKRNPNGVGIKVIHGHDNEANFGEFPWMVAIVRHDTNMYQCGGSLIHPEVVLTAAHCVDNLRASNLKVRVGEWDTQTIYELYPHQTLSVKNVVLHENFTRPNMFNDFALLYLATPVDMNYDNVGIACLPESGATFNYRNCFATGWGRNYFGRKGAYSAILKRLELPVLPVHVCEANLRNTKLGEYFHLDKSFICAGGDAGKDTCEGDGGSPLVCETKGSSSYKDTYVQAGIVSWGLESCGDENVPGVYSNVAYALPWIMKQLQWTDIDIWKYQTPLV